MNDAVNHPQHYTDGKIEVIDFIEDKKLNYHRGNAVKYIARAGKKDPNKELEDIEKAIWYLSREVNRLKRTDKPDIFTTNAIDFMSEEDVSEPQEPKERKLTFNDTCDRY